MLEIQSAKLVLSLVDTETGEIITKEATLGDFKDSKKKKTSSKKPKDDDPVAKVTLLDNKIQFNASAVTLTGYEPDMKIDIKFEKKGRVVTPVICPDDKTGNRLTKTYTISCRGTKHDNLADHGNVFELIPYEGQDGWFKLKGDSSKEDDIIDLPEELNDPEEIENDDLGFDSSSIDNIDFNLDL